METPVRSQEESMEETAAPSEPSISSTFGRQHPQTTSTPGSALRNRRRDRSPPPSFTMELRTRNYTQIRGRRQLNPTQTVSSPNRPRVAAVSTRRPRTTRTPLRSSRLDRNTQNRANTESTPTQAAPLAAVVNPSPPCNLVQEILRVDLGPIRRGPSLHSQLCLTAAMKRRADEQVTTSSQQVSLQATESRAKRRCTAVSDESPVAASSLEAEIVPQAPPNPPVEMRLSIVEIERPPEQRGVITAPRDIKPQRVRFIDLDEEPSSSSSSDVSTLTPEVPPSRNTSVNPPVNSPETVMNLLERCRLM